MFLTFLAFPSWPYRYQLSILSACPADYHTPDCPYPCFTLVTLCFYFRPEEVHRFPKSVLFFLDILFYLMKDANSAYIPSTLLGKVILRYSFPPFIPETHLLYLPSSIQRDAFSERTGFLPSFLKQHPCSVSATSEIHVVRRVSTTLS